MKTIRFRITSNRCNTCSLLFYGTENDIFIINSVNGKEIKMEGSAFKLYSEWLKVLDEDFNTIELL